MKNSNVNDHHLEKTSADNIPDVVLVKKVYAEKSVRNRRRRWRLKHMEGLHHAVGASSSMSDGGHEYNDFLEDLEEDPELRKNVNVYKDPSKNAGQMAVDDQDSVADSLDIPQITLAEMLDDLDLESEVTGGNSHPDANRITGGSSNDATEVSGAPMIE